MKSPTVPPLLTHIRPGEDFYSHVNGKWQQSASIPRFVSSYGVSEEIEERVRGALMNSIQRKIQQDPEDPLSLLAKSALNSHVQSNNVRDVRHLLQSFACIRSPEDLGREVGRLNRMQLRAPITFSVSADTYNSSLCRVHLYEPVVGLPARSHYLGSGGKNRILQHYEKLLKETGTLLEVEGLERVIGIERSILKFLSEGDSLRDPLESYIPFRIRELEQKWKRVPWSTIFLAWGMTQEQIRNSVFIVTNEDYMGELNRMFEVLDYDSWKVWLRAGVVMTLLEYLPPPFDDMHHELFGKRLKGNAQKLPQRLLMLRVLQTFATQALSRLFVEDHVDEDVKDTATTMVRRLKKAASHRIRSLAWMMKSTKQTAIDKIVAMRFQVAYPSAWYTEFYGTRMDGERLVNNILVLSTKDTDRMLKDLGNGCGETNGTWDDGAFDVNAYYYPDKNMLTVPAGMLRPPFFDLRRSVAWNYGAIGCAIGHEMTHGFDADGKNYDLKGSYREWWTEHDNAMYDKMTKDLVALFDNQEYAGGKVDGHLTLSENIADIGGVGIALDALRAYLHDKNVKESQKLEAYRDFFISYAVSWRNKDRPQKAKQSLYMDVHAPAPLRVNLVVAQFEEFYKAFAIRPDDPGYTAPDKRIQLW
jgi:predicted metalloendopeptidase